jgi:hypothetical protein
MVGESCTISAAARSHHRLLLAIGITTISLIIQTKFEHFQLDPQAESLGCRNKVKLGQITADAPESGMGLGRIGILEFLSLWKGAEASVVRPRIDKPSISSRAPGKTTVSEWSNKTSCPFATELP